MIINGRALAREMLARTKAHADKLPRRPKVVALVASDTPATRAYLAMKGKRAIEAGCIFETRALGATYGDADALIVQLPVPMGINQKEVCDTIPVEKDADVLSSGARNIYTERNQSERGAGSGDWRRLARREPSCRVAPATRSACLRAHFEIKRS